MNHTDPAYHGVVVALTIIIVVCGLIVAYQLFYYAIAMTGGRSLKRRARCNYLNAQRNAQAVMIMTSTVMSIDSIEPSPLSGEKPKCRSIKSIGAALCAMYPKQHRATNRNDSS